MHLGERWWQQQEIQIAGVGLIISHNSPNNPHILTLQENTAKPALLKEAGTRSFPMETCDQGERVRKTLSRLVREELGGMGPLNIEKHPSGLFQVVTGIWLLVWWATTENNTLPTLPPEADVSDPQWEPLAHLTNGYPNLRHGAREPLQARENGERLVLKTCAIPVPT